MRRSPLLLIVFVFLVHASVHVLAAPQGGPDEHRDEDDEQCKKISKNHPTRRIDKSCFFLLKSGGNWQQAQDACKAIHHDRCHLAWIEDRHILDKLRSWLDEEYKPIPVGGLWWVGGRHQDGWHWVSADDSDHGPMDGAPWLPGQPAKSANEQCAHLRDEKPGGLGLADGGCTQSYHHLCEVRDE